MRVFWILRRRSKTTTTTTTNANSISSPSTSSSSTATSPTTTDVQNNNYISKTYFNTGCGRTTKRGYQKLSDGPGSNEQDYLDVSTTTAPPPQGADSETEGTSGTDCCSDYDVGGGDSDSEYDESLTCNVCDRSFSSTRKLAQHQQRKRHYGCSICDSIFPNLMTLELHKESLEHWSDGDDDDDRDSEEDGGGRRRGDTDSDDDDDDEEEEDDDYYGIEDVQSPTEELERLL